MMFIQSMFLSMIGPTLWANSSYWPHVYFADINTFSDINRIYIALKVQATRSAVALLFWQRWRKWRKISRVIQIQIDIGQTFLKQWQQYRIDKYHSGFYLGFIVWGRSPEWPKTTCFLGGVRGMPSGNFLKWICSEMQSLWCILRHNFEKFYCLRNDLVGYRWFSRYNYSYTVMKALFLGGESGHLGREASTPQMP